jgi:hypothetical protein
VSHFVTPAFAQNALSDAETELKKEIVRKIEISEKNHFW